MIEANSASSSANDVSIRTWVSGCFARISRVASMPLPSVEPDVHHDDVGSGAVGLVDRLLDRAGLGRHHDVVLGVRASRGCRRGRSRGRRRASREAAASSWASRHPRWPCAGASPWTPSTVRQRSRSTASPTRSRKSFSVASATRYSTARSIARADRARAAARTARSSRAGSGPAPSGATSRSASSAGNSPASARAPPSQRQHRLRGHRGRARRARSRPDARSRTSLAEPHLGEQQSPRWLRVAGESRQPVVGRRPISAALHPIGPIGSSTK